MTTIFNCFSVRKPEAFSGMSPDEKQEVKESYNASFICDEQYRFIF